MSVEHTPSPWEAIVVQGDVARHRNPECRQNLNTSAAWAVGPKARSALYAVADSLLIAAAPDLLEACRTALRAIDHATSGMHHGVEDEVAEIQAAIDKATGRRP